MPRIANTLKTLAVHRREIRHAGDVANGLTNFCKGLLLRSQTPGADKNVRPPHPRDNARIAELERSRGVPAELDDKLFNLN
jgi:hypothetical protein